MTLLGALTIVAGAAIVGLSLFDVFQAVVLPRASASRWRLSVRMVRWTWPLWKRFTDPWADAERRENVLGSYAPLLLVGFLFMWGLCCIVGFGLVLYGLRMQVHPVSNLGQAIYLAGASFLTIGYGDIVPVGGSARVVALCAGASGFAIVAIVTSFLFQLFGAFGAREYFVVSLAARGGSPPSGVTLLESYARYGVSDDLDDLFEDGMRWAAMLLESHIAYPILAYFRSSHDSDSWVAALGALLDAATLKIAVVDDGPPRHAKFFNTLARHLVTDLTSYFRLASDGDAGVERREFDLARGRLAAAGLPMYEPEEAWLQFKAMREVYAPSLNAMAHYWRIPPAEWIGDRSFLRNPHPTSGPVT